MGAGRQAGQAGASTKNHFTRSPAGAFFVSSRMTKPKIYVQPRLWALSIRSPVRATSFGAALAGHVTLQSPKGRKILYKYFMTPSCVARRRTGRSCACLFEVKRGETQGVMKSTRVCDPKIEPAARELFKRRVPPAN